MLLEDEQFECCPSDFKINCKHYKKICNQCKGKSLDNLKLCYAPIKNIGVHPLRTQIKKEKSDQRKEKRVLSKQTVIVQNNKRGRKKELEVFKQLNKSQSITPKYTANSGAMFQDGDLSIDIKGVNYNAEVKSRTSKNLLGPTKKEWDKAKKQQVDLFICKSDEYGSVITMDLNTFLQILEIKGEN